MDFQLIKTEMVSLRRKIDELTRRSDRQAANDVATGGGTTSVTAPITNSGTPTNPNLGLSVTPASPGGAVALQGATPGTAQTGNANLTGKFKAGIFEAATQFILGSIPIIDRGNTFPSVGSAVDGQRYWHTTYRSWFTFVSADSKYRQESPGVFDGSFPTVATGDNTVAPKIQVQRRDLNNTVFWWDGANWHYATNQIVLLAAPARLIDANSGPYAAAYNQLVTATSTNTFVGGTPTPAKLAAVFLSVTLIGNAVGTLSARLENPSALTGATSISSYAGVTNVVVTGMVLCGVNSSGQIKFTNGATALSRFVIDVVGYQLDLV